MPTEAKRKEIDALIEKVRVSEAIYIAEYRGLTVSKATAVRRLIHNAGGEMKVTKNTLMRIALREAGLQTAKDGIDTGPNAYVFSFGDISATAKVLRDFSREKGNEALVIKGGIMGNHFLTKDQVIALADLPPREVLLAALLGTLNGPIRAFVTVLSGPTRGLVTALSEIIDKKKEEAA
ncbi:MAG: 50S ribosomal protein L10 [Synergistaceae bacterium]|jgi:large subunit ribosomal protein L10|nr:50S ribosomal protein L10 [Synergistaceae bacterium]